MILKVRSNGFSRLTAEAVTTNHSANLESCGTGLLCYGDHLTRAEFERRYADQSHLKKAELIEGNVAEIVACDPARGKVENENNLELLVRGVNGYPVR